MHEMYTQGVMPEFWRSRTVHVDAALCLSGSNALKRFGSRCFSQTFNVKKAAGFGSQDVNQQLLKSPSPEG